VSDGRSVAESGHSGQPHHWMISAPNGPSSEGVCKECGQRRDFLNSFTRAPSTWLYRSVSQTQDPPSGHVIQDC
jgi:hypothetical protein